MGEIEKLKEQSDFWNELTAEEKARIEGGINDLDTRQKHPLNIQPRSAEGCKASSPEFEFS